MKKTTFSAYLDSFGEINEHFRRLTPRQSGHYRVDATIGVQTEYCSVADAVMSCGVRSVQKKENIENFIEMTREKMYNSIYCVCQCKGGVFN